ncbi:hypothetical protein PCASD_21987 [Puccinia coronata f. sp. avenae]|uniref:Uncharacterized protein n=1 Tax=Puccinia coronata f. sp. avenae TaxID=200324 RepID=A0A2N5U3A8_9BASI|nr:hypothetical protein PCASD_21987 [Puccinia coronata f. sp. avenae]
MLVSTSMVGSPMGGQASLLAKRVYTSMAVRHTGIPSSCTAGSPARHAGVHQLCEQAHMLTMLVYTSSNHTISELEDADSIMQEICDEIASDAYGHNGHNQATALRP